MARLRPHLQTSGNFCQLQSGYRSGHSTETALLQVLDGIYTAADRRELSVMVSLDISAAFDTIVHSTLLTRLQSEFGVSGTVIGWVQSYLTGRSMRVTVGQQSSETVLLSSGVPQGSVLGPLLFTTYTSPIGDVISQHGVQYHQYADDTQLHLSMRVNENTATKLRQLSDCTDAVKTWYLKNGLMLNPDKSEVMLMGTGKQLHAADNLSRVTVAGVELDVKDEIKTLGVVLDNGLTFSKHANAVARSCQYHIQAIRHIRHLLTRDLALTLACSMVLSRLDYCNSLLYGAPITVLNKLQRIQNNTARVVLQVPRITSSKPLLKELHWLPVQSRIRYKLATIVFQTRTTSTPPYLNDLIFNRTCSRSLRSSAKPLLNIPSVRTELAKRAFRYSAPSVWNSLPVNVVNSSTLSSFKSSLKTELFKLAFSD